MGVDPRGTNAVTDPKQTNKKTMSDIVWGSTVRAILCGGDIVRGDIVLGDIVLEPKKELSVKLS